MPDLSAPARPSGRAYRLATMSLGVLATFAGLGSLGQAASADTAVPQPLPSLAGQIVFPQETRSVDVMESTLLVKLNAERAQAGLAPLAIQPWAAAVARAHSQDMAAARNMWHNYAGYITPGHQAMGAYLTGENVAIAGTLDEVDYDLVHSPEHLANILYPRFNYVGIGIATDPLGYVYVTQDFADIQPATQAAAPTLAAKSPVTAPSKPAAVAPASTMVSHPVVMNPTSAPAPVVPVAVPLVLAPQEVQPPQAPSAATVSSPVVALTVRPATSQRRVSEQTAIAAILVGVCWLLSRRLRSSAGLPWSLGSRRGRQSRGPRSR